MQGTFTVIEGMDASGKSTQIDLLQRRMVEELAGPARILKSPDPDTETGKLLYAHIGKEWAAIDMLTVHEMLENGNSRYLTPDDIWNVAHHPGNALIFQALMAVNRYEGALALRALLDSGIHVLHDRYFTSSEAYGLAEGLDPYWLHAANSSLPRPDLALYLDISVEESLRRRPERRDRLEEDVNLLARVRKGYRDLFIARQNASLPYRIIDGSGTPEEVHELVWQAWKRKFRRFEQ